jgi:hypothetical protein
METQGKPNQKNHNSAPPPEAFDFLYRVLSTHGGYESDPCISKVLADENYNPFPEVTD